MLYILVASASQPIHLTSSHQETYLLQLTSHCCISTRITMTQALSGISCTNISGWHRTVPPYWNVISSEIVHNGKAFLFCLFTLRRGFEAGHLKSSATCTNSGDWNKTMPPCLKLSHKKLYNVGPNLTVLNSSFKHTTQWMMMLTPNLQHPVKLTWPFKTNTKFPPCGSLNPIKLA